MRSTQRDQIVGAGDERESNGTSEQLRLFMLAWRTIHSWFYLYCAFIARWTACIWSDKMNGETEKRARRKWRHEKRTMGGEGGGGKGDKEINTWRENCAYNLLDSTPSPSLSSIFGTSTMNRFDIQQALRSRFNIPGDGEASLCALFRTMLQDFIAEIRDIFTPSHLSSLDSVLRSGARLRQYVKWKAEKGRNYR